MALNVESSLRLLMHHHSSKAIEAIIQPTACSSLEEASRSSTLFLGGTGNFGQFGMGLEILGEVLQPKRKLVLLVKIVTPELNR